MLKFNDFLTLAARKTPQRLAIASSRKKITYKELNSQSTYVAQFLNNKGAIRGDVVALMLDSGVEWGVVWYACQKLGLIVLPLHLRLRESELIRQMEIVNPSILIFGENYAERAKCLQEACKCLVCALCVSEMEQQETLLSSNHTQKECFKNLDNTNVQIDADDPALILFTSGTTGNPKAVMRTQEMIVLHSITLAMSNNIRDISEVMLTTSPLYHTGGLISLFKMAILGGTAILLNKIDPVEILDMIENFGVTQIMMLPPCTYERLYNSRYWQGRDLSSVKSVAISAGKCTDEIANHIFEMFPNCMLSTSWGATETCSVTSMQISKDDYQKDSELIKSIGYINDFYELRIVDEEGNEIEPGHEGEALVRSPMVFSGYLNLTESNCEYFADDQWFKTGDILREDPTKGYFYYIDRMDDMIKSGGENISAIEVERALEAHPGVIECAAVGIPDERFGEAVGVAVVLNPTYPVPTSDELVDFSLTKLASFKKPRYMVILDSLPKNDVGKVRKELLRKRANELFRSLIP